MKNLLPLTKSIDALILSLTGNDIARTYYQRIKDKLLIIDDEQELKKILEAICASGKVKDVYGLSLEQCDKWDKMWSEPDFLRSKF